MGRGRFTLAGLGAILLWSSTIAVMRSLTERIGIARAAWSVFLLAGALAVGGSLLRGGRLRDLWAAPRSYLLVCGSLFVFYTVALTAAVGLASDRIEVLEVGLLNYLWPTLTLLFSLLLLRKRAGLLLVPATACALAGVFLVLSQGTRITPASIVSHLGANPAAYGLALAAAVSWGLYSALARRLGGTGERGAVALFLAVTGIAVLALRPLIGSEGAWNLRSALEVAFMASATAGAYVLWDLAMRRGDVVLVASCSYFTPLLSTIVSCLYLAVAPGRKLWWGCGLLIAGALASRASISDRRD